MGRHSSDVGLGISQAYSEAGPGRIAFPFGVKTMSVSVWLPEHPVRVAMGRGP